MLQKVIFIHNSRQTFNFYQNQFLHYQIPNPIQLTRLSIETPDEQSVQSPLEVNPQLSISKMISELKNATIRTKLNNDTI